MNEDKDLQIAIKQVKQRVGEWEYDGSHESLIKYLRVLLAALEREPTPLEYCEMSDGSRMPGCKGHDPNSCGPLKAADYDPKEIPILDERALIQGKVLWRKYEGSRKHPSSENAKWLNERNMWVWFSRYGRQLLERVVLDDHSY